MQTLRRIDLMSIGKIYAVLGAIYGLVAMLVFDAVFAVLGKTLFPAALSGALGGAVIIGLPILGIVGGAILGFIFSVISAAIYNVIAEAIGGVKFNISGKQASVNGIDMRSYVKIVAIGALIAGLVLGIVVTFALPSLLSSAMMGTGGAVLGVVSGFALVGLPVLFLIIGAIGAAVYAILFNFFTKNVGGIGVNISGKPTALKRVDPMGYAKIVTLIGVVMTLIIGVLTALGTGHDFSAGAVRIVTSLITNVIATFVSAYIGILIFNFVASKIGGIVIDLK
ncbi:MAG: hypothetical protein KGH59_05000 [Candidatus Micrarchaeota archaeon]|nr:hypothetical protein [Candidatus Micrarchaeota archaeon]MDE1847267.1 hypothetical protein [Candidatus Micrarchaeota archaeon]